MEKEEVTQQTKWEVTNGPNPVLDKVLEWLLNNGGGYNYWNNPGHDITGDTRALVSSIQSDSDFTEMEIIYNLYLLNRLGIITLNGFGGDKGTEFDFNIDYAMIDGAGINVVEVHG